MPPTVRAPWPAVTTELLKNKRWLLNARPRLGDGQEHWEVLLTVSPTVQGLFLRRAITSFVHRCRKVRASIRPKMRWTLDEWERNVDFACLFTAVRSQAALQSGITPNILDKVAQAFLDGRALLSFVCSRTQLVSFRLLCGYACMPELPQGLPARHGGALEHEKPQLPRQPARRLAGVGRANYHAF